MRVSAKVMRGWLLRRYDGEMTIVVLVGVRCCMHVGVRSHDLTALYVCVS